MKNLNLLKALIEPKLPGIFIPILLGILLWVFPSIFSKSYDLWPTNNTLFVDWIDSQLEIKPSMSLAIGLLYTIFIGFLLVQLNKVHSFIRIRSLLLFFFYILIIGTNPNLHSFSFSQISNLFMLMALWQLFSIYDKREDVKTPFNITFYLAIGSFFSIELLLFTPLFFIGIQRLKGLTSKTFIAGFIGLITPFILFISIAYITNKNIDNYLDLFLNQFSFNVNFNLDYISVAYLIVLCLIGFIALLNILNDPFSDKIKVGRMLGFISYGFFFFLLLFFVKADNFPIAFSLGTFYSTILYTHYFSLRNTLFTKILFFFQLLVCLLFYLSTVFSYTPQF